MKYHDQKNNDRPNDRLSDQPVEDSSQPLLPEFGSKIGPDCWLEEQARAALALEVESSQVERLEQFWHDQRQQSRRRQRRRLLVGVAVAASLVVVAGWAVGIRHIPAELPSEPMAEVTNDTLAQPQAEKPGEQKDSKVPRKTNLAADLPSRSSNHRPILTGRVPTALERLMFVAQTRRQVPSPPARLQQKPKAEQALAVHVEFEQPEQSVAESVKLLLEDAKKPAAREKALAAIEALAGVDHWQEIAKQTSDEAVRQAIAFRLLASRESNAMLVFLACVYDEQLRGDTLKAALRVRDLPIDELITFLDHSEERVRLAAAITLGEMNRCEMTTAIIERINERPSNSKEAWYALLACRCDAADQFLSHANQSPRLLGQLNNARLQWQRFLP